MVSKNYQFDSFATHSAVDSSSSCTGTWRPDGGTTWRTEIVPLNKLSGAVEFAEGGVCYIPFTLPVYTDGAPDVQVTVDTETTADTLAAGFSGTITSNYRITQVDAVLSTAGAPDQVFTHYPAYDAWSYEFNDSALNRALASASSGNCSLTVNVHSGPIADPSTMKDPVTKAFDVSIYLSEPNFEMTSDAKVAHQGQSVAISIKPLDTDITAAKIELTYDMDTYAFDLAETRSANPGLTVRENADGSVYIEYAGSALEKGKTMAQVYFIPHRTGGMPIPASQTGIFAAHSAWKATASNPEMLPARFGGEAVAFDIGYNLKVYDNYAGGKSLILLAAEEYPLNATYGNQKMVEVTPANYKLDDLGFTHVYAIVVDSVNPDLISAEQIASTADTVLPFLFDYDCDVNRSGSVDIADAQAAANIIAGRMPLEGNLEKWLVADADANGKVDTNDIRAILAAANR